jgi:hypothetical protein
MKNKVLVATTVGLLLAIGALTTIYRQQAFANGGVTQPVMPTGHESCQISLNEQARVSEHF